LNVLVFPAWYPSPENPAAVSFLREHVRAVGLRHNVLVFVGSREPSEVSPSVLVERTVEDGVPVLRMKYRRSPVPKTTWFRYGCGIISAYRSILRGGFRPDLIHAHFYSAALPAVFLGRLFGVPVLLTEHSASFLVGLGWLTHLEAKLALARVRLVIAVSSSLREQMESRGVRGEFRVIPNPVDTSVFSPDPSRRPSSGAPKRVLIASRLHPVKGFPTLLKGLAILTRSRGDFVLDVVGDGELRSELESLAWRLGLQHQVIFHGFQPREAVAVFMRRSHVFVLSSRSENCPCVLLEALASGLPVVSSDVGGVREVVPKDMGAFFPEGDEGALADALSSVLDRLDSYDPLEIAAYARAHFSLEVVGGQVNEAYSRVLES
jgi:glycosyltransferase involved in cell wall biosynthesis